MSERHLRCYSCKKRHPEDDTALIQAWVGGNWRRGNRRVTVRVCRTCTHDRVEYARKAQASGTNAPINGTIKWAQAARSLGIDIAGLKERT